MEHASLQLFLCGIIICHIGIVVNDAGGYDIRKGLGKRINQKKSAKESMYYEN